MTTLLVFAVCLAFFLGVVTGLGIAVRVLEWARTSTLSDSVDELVRRQREGR